MSSFSKIVASLVSIPVAFVKEVAEDVKTLEDEKARKALSKMEMPEFSEEEIQEMLKKRARQAASR